MRLLFVADGRSPIALNWMAYFVRQGHEVHLASTFPCQPELNLASLHLVPVALSEVAGGAGAGRRGGLRRLLPLRLRTLLRHWLGPLTLPVAARRLAALMDAVRPDLVQAMRVPYEGMLAALANPPAPLLVSVWGNDFTLHAPSNAWMRRYTRLAMQRADALHADCQRDVRLARQWGFEERKPAVVLPGAGGVQRSIFYPPPQPPSMPVVINPRGFRSYVRNDTFFRALPRVLQAQPEARFLCPNMAGEVQAGRWVQAYGLQSSVQLLPRQTREQMAELFRSSRVAVSPSTHDGTPNTLLEAMACGCFPLAGDLESLREWITPRANGLLFDPGDSAALGDAILEALGDESLRLRAAQHNTRLIAERADYEHVMGEAEGFLARLARHN